MTQDVFNNDNHGQTLAISNQRIARKLTALQFTHHPFSLGATVTFSIPMSYLYINTHVMLQTKDLQILICLTVTHSRTPDVCLATLYFYWPRLNYPMSAINTTITLWAVLNNSVCDVYHTGSKYYTKSTGLSPRPPFPGSLTRINSTPGLQRSP